MIRVQAWTVRQLAMVLATAASANDSASWGTFIDDHTKLNGIFPGQVPPNHRAAHAEQIVNQRRGTYGTNGAPGDRSGIGLTVVRAIALMHGGDLDYRHEAGTNIVSLELPASH